MGTTQAAAGGEAGGLGWAQTPGCSEIWGAPPGDMRAYIHTYIHTYVCMYVCMYVRMPVRTYVCLYVCLPVCLYACMSVCPYACSFRTFLAVGRRSAVAAGEFSELLSRPADRGAHPRWAPPSAGGRGRQAAWPHPAGSPRARPVRPSATGGLVGWAQGRLVRPARGRLVPAGPGQHLSGPRGVGPRS